MRVRRQLFWSIDDADRDTVSLARPEQLIGRMEADKRLQHLIDVSGLCPPIFGILERWLTEVDYQPDG